jgi:hypothetical protein
MPDGRHTEWLSEAQVADLYRARFTAGQSQADRAGTLIAEAKDSLAKGGWLITVLVPDSPGDYGVSRERVQNAYQWWGQRRQLDVLPGTAPWSATESVGPRRVILSRSDGQTTVPSGLYVELHDDGACVIAQSS